MSNPISPKVTSGAVAGVLAAALLPYITPDLFAGLGKYSGLVYGLVIAVVVTLAGYFKADPLRATPAPADAPVGAPAVPEAPATPPVSFAATQAKLDAIPVAEVTPTFNGE